MFEWMRRRQWTVPRILMCFAVVTGVPARASATWTASWAASPAAATGPDVSDHTVRQSVRISIGGTRLRVRYSNEVAGEDVTISDARIALPGPTPGSILAFSQHVLTFGGSPTVHLARGAPVLSDPVDFALPPLATVTISTYFTGDHAPSASHPLGQATTYVAPGDVVSQPVLPSARTITQRLYLSGVSVFSVDPDGSVIGTIGDSITDGAHSSLDTNGRWTDRLAERLVLRLRGPRLAIVNGGIGGNRVLEGERHPDSGPSALARFDRDVLSLPGLRILIVLEGSNDLGSPVRSDTVVAELIAGYRQMIDRAHARNVKVIGATMLPFGGADGPYGSPAHDLARQAVNAWIRASGAYDGVIDFDAVMRDPSNPLVLRTAYDSGDHLHPNDAGYRAMGNAVDLDLFDLRCWSVRPD